MHQYSCICSEQRSDLSDKAMITGKHFSRRKRSRVDDSRLCRHWQKDRVAQMVLQQGVDKFAPCWSGFSECPLRNLHRIKFV